jgi:rubrerythrin
MKMLQKWFNLLLVVALGLSCTAAATPSTKTLNNLQEAFNGESNAHARYLAFAAKADEEGYGEVASLFRAAASAEEIHAANHAAVIRKLGGVPHAAIQAPNVESTRENLEHAIEGESYERDIMYPRFLLQARAAHLGDAVTTLSEARAAEAEHAKLYKQALSRLDQLKGSRSKEYFVCPVCGYTTARLDFANCPTCSTPKEVYLTVS